MKTKIKEALKTEFVNLGLGEKAFDGVAGLLLATKTITDESQIATVIKGAEIKDLLIGIQSEGDKARQAKADAERALNDYKAAHPEQPTPSTPPVPHTPPAGVDNPPPQGLTIADIKSALNDLVAPINEKLLKFEAEKATNQKMQEALSLRASLGIDMNSHKEWVEDAWALATSNVAEQDTPQSIVDRFKTRFDGTMKMLGVNGYVPAPGGPGATKSKAQQVIEQINTEKANASASGIDLKSRVNGVVVKQSPSV